MQPAFARSAATACALVILVLVSAVPMWAGDLSPIVAGPFGEQASRLWLQGEAVTEGYQLSLEYEPVGEVDHRAILIHAQPSRTLLLAHWNGEPGQLEGATPRAVTSGPFGRSFPRVNLAEAPPATDDAVTATLLTVSGERRLLTAARVGSLDGFEIETHSPAGDSPIAKAPETPADD